MMKNKNEVYFAAPHPVLVLMYSLKQYQQLSVIVDEKKKKIRRLICLLLHTAAFLVLRKGIKNEIAGGSVPM